MAGLGGTAEVRRLTAHATQVDLGMLRQGRARVCGPGGEERFESVAELGLTEGTSRSVSRALQILDVVAVRSREPVRLVDVVAYTGLPKTTCHRLLATLTNNGLLRVDDQGRFGPGALLLATGMNFLSQTDLRSLARPLMEDLALETQETCHLGVMQFPWVVYLEKVESPLAIRMHSEVGAINPIYCTGLGKALLAFSPSEVIDQVCAMDLEPRTEQTITDPAHLRQELAKIRERGFAIDDVENEAGIRCVGAPIRGHDGNSLAALSLAGPETRLTLEVALDLGERVALVAERISRQMGYRPAAV